MLGIWWHRLFIVDLTEGFLCRRIMGSSDGFHSYEPAQCSLRPEECVKLADCCICEQLGTCKRHFFSFLSFHCSAFWFVSPGLVHVCKYIAFLHVLTTLETWGSRQVAVKQNDCVNHCVSSQEEVCVRKEWGFYDLTRGENKGDFLNVSGHDRVYALTFYRQWICGCRQNVWFENFSKKQAVRSLSVNSRCIMKT